MGDPDVGAAKDPIDLVLQGGGVKGIALVGAVDRLLERFEVRRVGGTSAGAIVAALIAAGYSREELREAMGELRYDRVPDPVLPVPVLGALAGLVTTSGLYRGDYIRDWVAGKLAAKGVRTFADLVLAPDDLGDPFLRGDRGYRLVVTATDITRGQGLRLPWDYRTAFAVDPAEQLVADAVRMSLSIPVFFRPVRMSGAGGETYEVVDGGVMSNFPVQMFDRQDGQQPRWPTLGAGVIEDLPRAVDTLVPGLPVPRCGALGVLVSSVVTAVVGNDQTYLAEPRNAERVFRADTRSVGAVDFWLDRRARDELTESGELAAETFLRRWSWDGYRDRFHPR
ncbi:patatin-like phospholipase family protein [Actinomycetospora chiangmaiensis]|uniref:patatin-like phospholipase family protein n=1 Tax=Actinomycetospora chiangmaiensis TaxID=402650 RepID=UPI000378896C|nr:patatin-like phospholipase family protein [Actinomycetospora chiangmaiensis]